MVVTEGGLVVEVVLGAEIVVLVELVLVVLVELVLVVLVGTAAVVVVVLVAEGVVLVELLVVLVMTTVVVVVVQFGMGVLRQPASTSQLSLVQGLPSSQLRVRQVASQGWQGPFAAPLSQVSGNSTCPLPQIGHGATQFGGCIGAVQ